MVLIVDDHVDSRDLMAAVLQELGVAMAEAGTGAGALKRVAEEPRPALIMIDLSLPDVHGTEVVRQLKADARTRDIPIVALSASVMSTDKAAAASCRLHRVHRKAGTARRRGVDRAQAVGRSVSSQFPVSS